MVINMRFLLFFFFLFIHSHIAFSQEPPQPICGAVVSLGFCDVGFACQSRQNSCVGNNNTGYFTLGEQSGNQRYYECQNNCVCPEGSTWYTNSDLEGNATSGCSPNGDGGPNTPDDCDPPQVEFAGLCRMPESSPEDCGSTYSTANSVQGGYVCSNDENCGDGSSPTIYTTANGSWKVCGSPDETPSSSGSNSSPPSSSPSTGGDSSTGSGNGSGSGSGDGSGNGNGNGSGNSSGGQTSSVSGGGGGTPSQSASSTSSSAHGAASSGSGAGNCDPTAHDYLACISREDPGNGDGSGDAFEPSGNKGAFDGEAAEERMEELEQEISQQMQTIKEEINNHLGGNVSGSGGLSDKCINIYSKQVCFGFAKWQNDLQIIGQAILLLAGFLSLAIVLSR